MMETFFAYMQSFFSGQLGMIIAYVLILMGLTDILVAMTLLRARAFGPDKDIAARSKPAFFAIFIGGFLLTAIGFHGLDIYYGIF